MATSLRRGKPVETGLMQSVDGRIRHQLLNEALLFDLDVARAANWVIAYNLQRPHLSPKYLTPAAYAT
ncbi:MULTISPECIES: transposase [unclassified Bradyrhizobium]|uniref:transposase n=1 Tax=unclassified Bradyrhizobium TaxID=2631580 RepID=UPI001CD57340|nr:MULTISPECIES: transposase [unclassified Bradyrhizobium]MCA1378658.1 transposase [Bradyrhizobium sp. IC4060]MCA1487738.1 transposase [Bradyrhizobium sp. IC4061]